MFYQVKDSKRTGRTVSLLLALAVFLLFLSACGGGGSGGAAKTAVTSDTFKESAVALGYEVEDLTYMYEGDANILGCYECTIGNLVVDFYVFDSADSGATFFDNNKSMISMFATGTRQENTEPWKREGNYQRYTLTSDNDYALISWVEDTALQATCYNYEKAAVDESSKSLGELLKKIGY